ncbi:RNA polymerase sigma factor [Lutibacter sp. A64]|uniref:RNA polymerase sigma factor n=1 Tax=Lutibacter sp. A64 TaxID=2918526 RepID=UPI001F06FA81|nr:RNA polymerase sigma factor [Lutibacter sp. A64]UMB54684.1 RNA polymerase sigma factor [Lutibacter sp. A64]
MKEEVATKNNLEKIIAECKKGNVLHQEMLYKHFYGYALSICRLYTYSNDDAVSILNDSFLKIFSSIKKNGYSSSIPFKNWLRRILINTAIDSYRKNLKHYYHLEIDNEETVYADSNIIEDLTIKDILKLLDQLPEMHRMVFNLYEIQGFSHQEIANKLEIGESTSRVFLTRAKKKLRILINENF